MLRLAEGVRGWDPAFCERQRGFLLRLQQSDGGFCGRTGGSDLYYTSFAVRALLLLDGLSRAVCDAVAAYLKRWFERFGDEDRPDALVNRAAWLQSVAALVMTEGDEVLARIDVDLARWPAALESYRAPVGGYARGRAGKAGSTYLTFLVTVCYELLGESPPDVEGIVRFVLDRRRGDGGFVEVAPARRGGTNPTAAAAAVLRRHGALNEEVRIGIRKYLTAVRDPGGGFRANRRAPAADLLSTFTGLTTADVLGLRDAVDARTTARFVEGLALADGGYRGGIWETEGDPEYTFYGLGSLALTQTWNDGR